MGSGPERLVGVLVPVRFFPLFPPPLLRSITPADGRAPGSNVIVAGTALFGAEDPAAVILTMKEAIDSSKAAWGTPTAKV